MGLKDFQGYRRQLQTSLLKRLYSKKPVKHLSISVGVWLLWVTYIQYEFVDMTWPLAIGMGVVIVPACFWTLKRGW